MIKKLVYCRRQTTGIGHPYAPVRLRAILVVAALGTADIGADEHRRVAKGATRAGAEYAKANWNNHR